MGFFNDVFKFLFGWMVPEPKQPDSGTLLTKPASDNPVNVIYGKRKTTGTIVFQNTTNPDDGDDVENDLLHMVIVWGEAVHSIDEVYLGDDPITHQKYNGLAYAINFPNGMGNYYYDELAKAGFDPKNKNHRLDGCAVSYIRLEWSIEKDTPFRGVPQVSALLSGRRVRPMSGGAARYSQNPAECLFDYLTNKVYGKGLSSADLDVSSFKRAVAICNQQVPKYQGASVKKPLFTTNVILDTSNQVIDNVTTLLKPMRAYLPEINGKLTLVIEQDDAPVNLTITDKHIRKSLKYSESGKEQWYNRVIVEFDDKDKRYSKQQVSWPEPDSDLFRTWLQQDNGELLEQRVTVNAITDYYEARQYARVLAMLSRESLTLELEVSPVALQYTFGDVIPVYYEKLGFNNKPFRLLKSIQLPDGWFKLTLQEHQPYIYNWLLGGSRAPIPDSTLPDPSNVSIPENLQTEVLEDGRVRLFWESIHHRFVVRIIKQGALKSELTVVQNECVLDELSAGTYQVKVRAINGLGYRSDWAALSFEVVRPVAPSISVTSKTHTTVNFMATLAKSGVGTKFEWIFDGFENSVSATGSTFTVTGLEPKTEYMIRCRAVNPSGVSPWAEHKFSTGAAPKNEQLSQLYFDLTQSPTWTALGGEWLPKELSNNVTVIVRDKRTKEVIAHQLLVVHLNEVLGTLDIEVTNDKSNSSDSELALEYQGLGTASLTIVAYHDGEVARQSFSSIGVTAREIDEIKDKIAAADILGDSTLKSILSGFEVFEQDLRSTLTLEKKTDLTNTKVVEVFAQQASDREAFSLKTLELQASVNENLAYLKQTYITKADTETAISLVRTQLQSQVNENKSNIEQNYLTKADTEMAISQVRLELASTTDENRAYVQQNYLTKTDTEEAISQVRIETNARFEQNESNLAQNYYSSADTDEAISAASTVLEAKMDGKIGAVSDRLDTVKSTADGNSSAISQLTLRANGLDQSVSAAFNRIYNVEVDADNNSSAISAMFTRANDIENGLDAVSGRVSQVEAKSDGTASAVESLSSRVSSAEHGVSSANIELSSHASRLGGLESKVSLSVTYNGLITGLDITPGKMAFAADAFEWHTSSSHVIRSRNGGIAGFTNGGFRWGIESTGSAYFNYVHADNMTLGSDNSKVSVAADIIGIYTGVRSSAKNWAFYAQQGAIGPHTSAHEGLLPKEINPEVGDIVCDVELIHIADISNAIGTLRLSNHRLDGDVRGVYTARRPLEIDQPAGLKGFEGWEQLAEPYDIAIFNAGGEGAINVCSEGGDLKTNDYICASSIPGKGMRLPDDAPISKAVAQNRFPITFPKDGEIHFARAAAIYIKG
ncbi:hypothetical protein [Pseudoalteromonas peptidolytica]|uniref:Fibronectin type-III domain-containing protein n=1 Tax=Pseudoalteromonas peptidolytica F12-50-A1 TaxID=1315280 RepID=A0A8I0MYP2_9GAMM|nr:hypothetical protein [Pseudoalteromonas peptidolytica]MBE0348291.1 hypothetical protein [Pseudoalteromonas peptidolytica F12-50-A1]NLR16575.1 hypothetical protein [Pseudoalteromonas peptidolytica]GEK08945.1 hypothetical protein PPE03_11940 [Pseudoalteromonas peptidolytica]